MDPDLAQSALLLIAALLALSFVGSLIWITVRSGYLEFREIRQRGELRTFVLWWIGLAVLLFLFSSAAAATLVQASLVAAVGSTLLMGIWLCLTDWGRDL